MTDKKEIKKQTDQKWAKHKSYSFSTYEEAAEKKTELGDAERIRIRRRKGGVFDTVVYKALSDAKE